MENQETQPQFKNEAEVLRAYIPILEQINRGKPTEIKGITGYDNREVSRAWRIIFKPADTSEIKSCAIFDWDDTLEPYTERKARLYNSYLNLIPETDDALRQKFIRACLTLNRAARVLPVNGIHPEHYSPLLELTAETKLIDSIRKSNPPNFLNNVNTNDEEAENLARTYLEEEVLPLLKEKVGVKHEVRNGKSKKYFIELANQSTGIHFNEQPDGVSKDIWVLYKSIMTSLNIPAEELDHFDLSDNVRFIVATFGEPGFQLEKVLNGIKAIQNKGKRIPDEILLYTRGRKNSVLRKIVEEIPDILFAYVDDSARQVESVAQIERVTPLHAQRQGSRRSTERVSDNIRKVNMKNTKLSEIASLVVEPKKF